MIATKPLIISAVRFEAEATLASLDPKMYDYVELGIGPVHALVGALKLREQATGRQVLYIGSAGTFGEFKEPYLTQVKRVWWLPTAERMGMAKYMPNLYPPLEMTKRTDLGLPDCEVFTSTSVSLSALTSVIDSRLPALEESVENMEAYCVVAQLLPVVSQLDILLGISNQVGSKGSEQWQTNFRKVAELSAHFIARRSFGQETSQRVPSENS